MSANKESEDASIQSDFLWSKREAPEDSINDASLATSPYADYYKMNHKKRGIAVIFNHVNFSNKSMPKRHGSDKDRDDMVDMLHELNFDVLVHNDLTANEVIEVLLTVSRFDFSNSDCLLIAVMSHGEDGIIYARDREYPTGRLWKHFTASQCPSLAGKPKLFFVQACRGADTHESHQLRYSTESDANNAEAHYSIPVMADILVMYSTLEGFFSWRDISKGSYFIQALVNQMRRHHRSKDLVTILTFVNREVAIDFTSQNPDNPALSNTKQMCSIVSMLTRLVHFQ